MSTQMSSTTSQSLVAALLENINKAVLGKPDAVKLALTALFAEGHLLIEDAPGVGKTSLAKAISASIDCDFARLQFTPDMLPSDIIGTSIFRPNIGEFEFREGPVFTNVLLADEINRTSPRTQSALLEAMSEHQVSIDGKTYTLKRPFFVLATQNPFEFEGTYPLPENQLDRFMLRIEIGYPSREFEKEVLNSHRKGEPVKTIKPVINAQQLADLQDEVKNVRVDDSLNDYILEIVTATRESDELALGVSTRGAIIFYKALQAFAFLNGRDYVIPDDIKQIAIPSLAHRIVVTGLIREGQRERAKTIIQQLLGRIPVPR